jgi:hypothetical protein
MNFEASVSYERGRGFRFALSPGVLEDHGCPPVNMADLRVVPHEFSFLDEERGDDRFIDIQSFELVQSIDLLVLPEEKVKFSGRETFWNFGEDIDTVGDIPKYEVSFQGRIHFRIEDDNVKSFIAANDEGGVDILFQLVSEDGVEIHSGMWVFLSNPHCRMELIS